MAEQELSTALSPSEEWRWRSPEANENLRRKGEGGSRFPEFGFACALTGGQWSDFNASNINMSSEPRLEFRAFGTTCFGAKLSNYHTIREGSA